MVLYRCKQKMWMTLCSSHEVGHLLFEYVHWCVSSVLTQVARVLFFPGHPPKSLEVSNSLVREKLSNAKSALKQEKSKRLNLCCCFILLTWSWWPNDSLRGFSLGSSVEFLKWLIFHLRQNEAKKTPATSNIVVWDNALLWSHFPVSFND